MFCTLAMLTFSTSNPTQNVLEPDHDKTKLDGACTKDSETNKLLLRVKKENEALRNSITRKPTVRR